eukprot:gene521-656_t
MQFGKRLLDRYLGNQIICKAPFVLNFFKKYPKLEFLNNVTNLAPMMKWSLSIVPISQILSGTKPPEKIDLAQSSSLCATGTIWTYYATLITPQNTGTRMLALCNAAMAICHGYNIFRRVKYDQSVSAETIVTPPSKN